MRHSATHNIFGSLLLAAALVAAPARGQWQSAGFDDADMAADLAEALTFRKYPTYPQYLEMMQYFALTYPDICRLDTFGTSVEGRLLLALNISDQADADEPEPELLYTAAIHGDELVGIVLLLRLAHSLLEAYGNDSEVDRLVNGLSIWINPMSNPDGIYAADEGLSMKGAQRMNLDGVDLNRDFPQPGLDAAFDTAGRARETIAMMEFLHERRFTLAANLHSGAEVVNYPWDHTYEFHADDDWYRLVSREYADEARAVDPGYMALFTNGITNGAEWYRIFGGRQDYVNFFLEGREVTLELSEEMLLESELLEEFWTKNHRSLLNYMSQCTYGIRGTVTDVESGSPLQARIFIPGHDSSYSVVHSSETHGDFYRLIREGVYDLVISSPGYLSDTIRGIQVTDFEATTLEVGLQPDPKAGLDPSVVDAGIRIYPNPARQRVFLAPVGMEPGPLEVRIITLEGITMLHKLLTHSTSPLVLNLELLPPGYYIVRVIDGNRSFTLPLILQ
jgi:hypothetical protein